MDEPVLSGRPLLLLVGEEGKHLIGNARIPAGRAWERLHLEDDRVPGGLMERLQDAPCVIVVGDLQGDAFQEVRHGLVALLRHAQAFVVGLAAPTRPVQPTWMDGVETQVRLLEGRGVLIEAASTGQGRAKLREELEAWMGLFGGMSASGRVAVAGRIFKRQRCRACAIQAGRPDDRMEDLVEKALLDFPPGAGSMTQVVLLLRFDENTVQLEGVQRAFASLQKVFPAAGTHSHFLPFIGTRDPSVAVLAWP